MRRLLSWWERIGTALNEIDAGLRCPGCLRRLNGAVCVCGRYGINWLLLLFGKWEW